MNNPRPSRNPSPFSLFIRKFFLSAFVVFSFILYALHKSSTGADSATIQPTPNPDGQNAQAFSPTTAPTQPAGISPTGGQDATLPPLPSPNGQQQAPAPTAVPPAPTTAARGGLKDGTYTGPQVDAFYGLVQVQAVVKNGKLTSVQFLQYPNDRRTSVQINSVAIPDLQQEALQAQSANVDIITGATLTSEGFMMSLQNALSKAGG